MIYKKRRKLSDNDIIEIAKKYSIKYEFKLKDPSAFSIACKRNILDKACIHMKVIYRKLSDLDIMEVAKKYSTRSEFYLKDKSAYDTAYKRNILDKVCIHMIPSGHRYLRSIYTLIWEDQYFYTGLSKDTIRRTNIHLINSHNEFINYMNYTNKTVKLIFYNNWTNNQKASKEESRIFDCHLNQGLIPLNIQKPGTLGGLNGSNKNAIPIKQKTLDKMPKNIIETIINL